MPQTVSDSDFSGGEVDFGGAQFSIGVIYLMKAKFPGREVAFSRA